MTAYNAIPDSDIDPESPLTTSLFTYLRNNPIAITEGATGAPKIQNAAFAANSIDGAKIITSSITGTQIAVTGTIAQAHLGANSVGNTQMISGAIHQAELSTTTASSSVSVTADGNNSLTLAGGTWSWWTASADSNNNQLIGFGNGNTAAGVIGLRNEDTGGASSLSFYIDERYVNSSPPYDMGDGDVYGFIYLLIDNVTKEIQGTQIAKDPTWAHNGTTDIRPTRKTTDGRFYKRIADTPFTFNQVKNNPIQLEQYLNAIISFNADPIANGKEVEITRAYKNSDMNFYPHPFGIVELGQSVVLIDGLSSFTDQIFALQDQGENISKLFHQGYFNISNTPLPRQGPDGLMIVSASWKNTGP